MPALHVRLKYCAGVGCKLPNHRMRNCSFARLFRRMAATVLAASLVAACQQPARQRDRTTAPQSRAPESDAPYQAEVEEGIGAAVAILVDTSGSMREPPPGDSRPKFVVAQEALEAMLDATDAFIAR